MSVLSHPVDVAQLPAGGVEIVANEPKRAALAAENDLVAVKSLSATVGLTPGPAGSVVADGRVIADIVQTCVVSLVPVDQHIDERFSVRFVPPQRAPKANIEVIVDPDAPDPPEVLEGPTLDIGALAEEYFVLAIDPYPRAPGAALPAELTGPGDAKPESPFAVLAALAKNPEDKS